MLSKDPFLYTTFFTFFIDSAKKLKNKIQNQKQNKTKQNQTKQYKTQNKTKQNKKQRNNNNNNNKTLTFYMSIGFKKGFPP